MELPAQTFEPTPFGKYLLLERIGTGGMAEIFRAKTFGAAGFAKEYAIKRILPNLGADEEFVSMFVNEAKLVVDLYHANIVQVFDLGHADGSYYIAMEFVHGKDLLDLLAHCAEADLKIPLKLTLFVMMELLKGLDFAHHAMDSFGKPLNIIHRDVSPSNIMLSYAGDVKVGDFGVAKARTQKRITEAGTLKGKVGYMSPEQVRGDEIDRRSDVFAAGIILYEALTMSRLFMGGSDLDVMLKVRDADIETELCRCAKRVPPSLLDILRRALCKQPKERFQSCEELYQAIRDFVYRHDIKTSNRDLASFLHRVFQDEIEVEKTRRLNDPKGNPVAERQLASPIPTTAPPKLRHPDGHPHTVPDYQFSISEATGKKLVAATHYRYRDPVGRIYGPMELQELRVLLANRPESSDEMVSVGVGPWQSPDDLPQLWEVQRPELPSNNPQLSGDVSAVGALRSGHDPALQGPLSRVSLARLLFRLHRRRMSGMLQIRTQSHHKEIFVRRGDPVLVTSSMPEELLGAYLVQRRIITESQLAHALDRLAEFGGRLGDALVGERVLGTHELFRYLAEQLQDRILNVFSWSVGDWLWFPGSRPKHQAVPLGVDLLELTLDGVRKHLSTRTLRRYFDGLEDTPFRAGSASVDLDALNLLEEELLIANLAEPGTTPKTTVASAEKQGLEAELVWRVLYMLTESERLALELAGEDLVLPT